MAVIGRPAPPSKLSSSDIADNAIGTAHIQANVITHADLAPNSVTSSEMADDAVGIAELSASGTPNATSFLRGDNSWQVVDTEGTGIKSTGESGGSKFLREDGDGTSSWQEAGSPSITDNGNSNAMTIDSSENVTLVESLTTPSLKQNSNQNLSGTYSAHQLFFADGFTLTGNLTVNEDIALTKLSDDGVSITLTTDGTSRTITGTGSIESSTIAQTPVTSLTGMTGEINSAVTGSPALNLSNATGTPAIGLNNATGIIPSGVTGQAGSLKLITTASNVTGSISEVYLGDIFSTTYRWYTIHLESWPTSDGGQLYVYPGDTAGNTWSAQGSNRCDGTFLRYYTGNTSNTPDNVTGNDFWSFKYSDRNNEDHLRHAVIHVFEPFASSIRTQGMTSAHIWGHSGNTTQSLFGPMGFSIRDAGTTHGLKFKYHTGNINYRIAVYGVVGSGVGI